MDTRAPGFIPFVGGVRFDTEPGLRAPAPEPSSSEDASYLDFIQGMRVFSWRNLEPELPRRFEQAARTFQARHGRPPATVEEVHQLLDNIPVIQSRKRLWRSTQEMMYRETVATLRRREAELLAELDEAERRGPGTLRWDRNFRYPAYMTRYEIHLQPGSYLDPLAGYIYHVATNVAFMGLNDNDDVQRSFVQRDIQPADGIVRRALDLGCSLGQSTTALKQRFPAAEVWGIDIAAPMIRYAHKRAVELNVEVHFAQQSADRLDFPDGHFDLVHAYLLFHEVPWAVTQRTFKQAFRVLRPGGVFNVFDFGTDRYRAGTPLAGYLVEFITWHNGEPFAADYCSRDVLGELRRAGFSHVTDTAENGISHTVAIK